MASPDRPDEGHIADTGMFQRFVEQESAQERQDTTDGGPHWALPVAIVLLAILVAVVVWLLVR